MCKFDVRQCIRPCLESQKGDENPESAYRIGRFGETNQPPSEPSGQGKGDSRT